jgi:hypothetical protein
MWAYREGSFDDGQIEATKKRMRSQIFYLLLYVDKREAENYEHVNVVQAIDNVLTWFSGLNVALNYPPALVKVISLLEAAKTEYERPDFDFGKYRKLILDAGNEVLKIGGE